MSELNLPAWVYDLIIAVTKHEAEHGKGEPCFNGVLEVVPTAVRLAARAIEPYLQSAKGTP